VIPPEQLAGALERLDPRERELLALSLRRRVPDEALARVYDVVPQEVARRRAAAIERLADELGAQRGEDLGAVLQALLDEGSWNATVTATNGEAPVDGEPAAEPVAEGGPEPVAEAEPQPVAEAEPQPVAEAEPQPVAEAEPQPVAEAEPQPIAEAVAEGEPEPVAGEPVAREPVLEMLAAREHDRGAGAWPAAGGGRRVTVAAFFLGSCAAALIGGAAAFVGLSEWGDDGGTSKAAQPPVEGEGTKHFVPQLGGPFEAPFPSEPQPISCYSTAYASGRSTLYTEPGGRVRIRLPARTEWGSPRVFGVVRHRGDWVAVQAPELRNGEMAWMPANRARIDCVRWSMRADLSRRRLYVEHNGKTVRRFTIAIGRKGNPTPKGRFSVTDKLRVTDRSSPYGCCVLALTGHQTRLPASWPGGDRLAVHATRELSTLGKPASLGCMRVTSAQARWLIRTIPLGAPMFVRS
jgi:L,D-transpeptidase-like protein